MTKGQYGGGVNLPPYSMFQITLFFMSDVTFKMTVATNVGLVRSNNEDNFIVNPDLNKSDEWFVPVGADEVIALGERGCVMVVADGMGGMNAGEVASELAVNSIRDTFSKVKDFSAISDCSNHIENFLKKAIVTADAEIKQRVKDDPSTSGMGTTIVLAWVVGTVAHIAWCGDSRAYLFNRKSGLSRLSNDHSYVQELVDTGKLDPELAFDHPNSNIITRSLGDSKTKAQPDYVCKGLTAGDYLLLCTDGLCGLVRDEEILDIMMKEHSSIEDYRTELFNAAFGAGGYDNVTIALFECIGVKEEELTSTVTPMQTSRKKKTVNPTNGKKFRTGMIIILTIILILLLLGAVAFYFDVVEIDEAHKISINFSNLKLKS
jgi:protein phosphatase